MGSIPHKLTLIFIPSFFLGGCAEIPPTRDMLKETLKVAKAPLEMLPSKSTQEAPSDKTSTQAQKNEDALLNVPPAVAPEERMETYPSPGEYVAFSLNVAQQKIVELTEGKNYQVVYPEVYNLGGMNQIQGLVYDQQTKDVILVGKYDPNRQPLTLDDFVVALRARFIHEKWPVVSIDPTKETPQTQMQIVRFEGGIENTQFGEDLFDADYRLKQIAMGLLSPGVPGLKTHWELRMIRAKEEKSRSYSVGSRFWFYPVLPSVSVRENVAVIKGLKVGIFTEVFSAEIEGKKIDDLSTFQDPDSAAFAKDFSQNFERLAQVHPSFSRVQGLDELVALTKAIEEIEQKPDFSFWLSNYRVKPVTTPREVRVLTRQEAYEVLRAGDVYRGHQKVSGGVRLTAIALRLKAGDVTALKQAVLKTRPQIETLSWRFLVGEWLISTSPGMLNMEDIVPLFTQALFLQQKERYDDALTLYEKILTLRPDWDWAYNNRGIAYAMGKGRYDLAITDFTKALEISPNLSEAYRNRGICYARKELYDLALADFTKALEINPTSAEAYYARGEAYLGLGKGQETCADWKQACELGLWCEDYKLVKNSGECEEKNPIPIMVNDAKDLNALLRDAIKKGDEGIISTLLDKGANINGRDKNGYTPIMWAAFKGRINIVQILITKGANVEVQTGGGDTALLLAGLYNHTEIVQMLKMAGASFPTDPDQRLLIASAIGDIISLRAALAQGASIDTSPNGRQPALLWAVFHGHSDVVKALLATGANVNARRLSSGQTALMQASSKGDDDLVRILLDARAEVNAKDRDGATALMFAAQNGHINIVKMLLDRGADVHGEFTDGTTALMSAVAKDHTDIVKLLLDKGADANAKIDDGVTLLMLAAQRGHTGIVKILLDKKAEVNTQARNGDTALIRAAFNNHIDTIKILLAGGAEVNIRNNLGMTALEVAERHRHNVVVQLLTNAGAHN